MPIVCCEQMSDAALLRIVLRGRSEAHTLDVTTRLPLAPCTSGFVGAGSSLGRLVCGSGGAIFVT